VVASHFPKSMDDLRQEHLFAENPSMISLHELTKSLKRVESAP